MNKLYLLIGWYVVILIGAGQLVMDGTTTENHWIGFIVLLGIPTGVYLYFKYRTPKKEEIKP